MSTNYLFKQVTIADPRSTYDGQIVDVLVKDGKVARIGSNVRKPSGPCETISWPFPVYVSPGWVDVGTQVGEPGLEHRETLDSASRAAILGGYTTLVTSPMTQPVVDSRNDIGYLLSKESQLPIRLFPLATISQNGEGNDLAEIMDLHDAGAVAFSDWDRPVQSNGLMLRALQYILSIDGLLINQPNDYSIALDGQIHEGAISTQMGLVGLPTLSEEMMLQRDIDLLAYTNSRLHTAGISSAPSVKMIQLAKKQQPNLSASVPIANLVWTDQAVEKFNTNYKLMPPLRENTDRTALRKALRNGIIDFVTSHHQPWDTEHKEVEFPYATFGMTSLATVFPLLVAAMKPSPAEVATWLSIRARQILKLPSAIIEAKNIADMTFFSPDTTWTLTSDMPYSKSNNEPLLNQSLTGRACGILTNGVYHEIG